MKDMKFRVRDEAHSVEIQQALFAQGFGWCDIGKRPQHTDMPHLYTSCDEYGKNIRYTSHASSDFFETCEHLECVVVDGVIVPVDEITTFKPEEVPPLGLRPRHIAEQQRMMEIVEAMQRYVAEHKHMPVEWLCELSDLNNNTLINEKI